MEMPFPKDCGMPMWKHGCGILGNCGVKVMGILKDLNGNYVMSIPLKYWKNVRNFFNQ